MPPERSITLLHLSDPQFGPKHRFDGTAPGSLFARLQGDLVDMRDRHDLLPDVVLVTGDLAETGKPSEFKQFRGFAEALVEHLGLPRRRLAMIPGNHDINRLACEAYFKECESEDRAPKPPYWPKLRHYAAMFAEFYAADPDLTFTEAEPYTEFRYPELGLVIAGLDSTIADSHRPEDHHGFVGEIQLRHFAGRLRTAADEGLFRIAAVHHHPIHPEGDPARQDLHDLRRFLAPHTNLIVHGHIHEDEFNYLDGGTPVPVLGVGSAGVKLAQRPEEVPNQYQWIRVFADRLEYGSRAYVPDQKRWVGDLRPDRDGERWWQRRPLTFDRVRTLTTAPTVVAASPEAALARDIAAHRAALARQLRRRVLLADLATYGEDSDLVQGLDLLKIFVPQNAIQEVPPIDRLHAALVDDDQFVPIKTEPQPVDTFVASESHPWTLILGTPGAGKTTLTTWVALKLSSEGEQILGIPADLVPLRIELRLFIERWSAAHAAGRAYDFFDYLDDVHHEESRPLRSQALRELAAAGRLVWLFDGLDEVASDDYRRTIADMIIGLRTRYAGRGIVTGRIVGCRPLQHRFHDSDIDCFTLLDLSDTQIAKFLDTWHALAFPGAPDLASRRHLRLRNTLTNSPALRDLCGNPLLLTLVALLNRGDELPRHRHRLLKRAAELMLSQWEANKSLPTPYTTPFDFGIKRRFLAELAWHMLTEIPGGAGNAISADHLNHFTASFCVRRLQVDPHTAAATARALIHHLRERNYVLGLLGGQSFGFLHKAFFEYFAAEEAHHRFRTHQWRLADLKAVFGKHWPNQAWGEALVLLGAVLAEDQPEHVIVLAQSLLAAYGPWQLDITLDIIAFVFRTLSPVVDTSNVAREFIHTIDRYLWAYLNNPFGHTIPPGFLAAFYEINDHWQRTLPFNPNLLVFPYTFLRGSPGVLRSAFFGHTFGGDIDSKLEIIKATATNGVHRAAAAWALRDRAYLRILANDASPDARTAADSFLSILASHREILRFGRPRGGRVRRAGIDVGVLEEKRDAGTRFAYDPAYLARPDARPIAPTMPLRAEPYDHPGLHPIFEGLLPQGWLLDVDLERYQLKPGDQFGLLLATGRDTIGALEIVPEEEDLA